ncbi:MAG TPA: hypothetical protein VGJ26_17750 [Pirellulales bacterium]|jgi:hypothetical protein
MDKATPPRRWFQFGVGDLLKAMAWTCLATAISVAAYNAPNGPLAFGDISRGEVQAMLTVTVLGPIAGMAASSLFGHRRKWLLFGTVVSIVADVGGIIAGM